LLLGSEMIKTMINAFLLLQADVAGAAEQMAEEAEELRMPFFEVAQKGGWLMLPVLILSILAVYIFFERYFAIQKAAKLDINFMNRIKDYIHEGKLDSALALCQSYHNPAARMIEKGIHRIGRPLNDVSTAIENTGKLEIYKLEKNLPTLATVAGGAPMIGFLGTVMGMVRAFYDMSHSGNNIDVSLLSGGIYTALVTTVAGLIVGIVAYFAYNVLVARVEKVVYQLEATTTEFMDLLNEPAK
jgi:biopolymer transport protein ExbB